MEVNESEFLFKNLFFQPMSPTIVFSPPLNRTIDRERPKRML